MLVTINDTTYEISGDALVSERKLEDLFEEELNEIYGEVKVCGYEYEAGRLLREVDPTAFRCGCADFTSEYYSEVWEGSKFVGYVHNDTIDSLDEIEDDD